MKSLETAERIGIAVLVGAGAALAAKGYLEAKVQGDIQKALVGGVTPTLETAPPIVPAVSHEACDGTDMSCPTGQYCFITDTIGLPEGVCLTPGDVQP